MKEMDDENMKPKWTAKYKALLLEIKQGKALARSINLLSRLTLLSIIATIIFVLVAPYFGFSFITIEGGSMSPSIPAGSIAAVQPVNTSDLKVGDVIAYRSNGEQRTFVTHRVSYIIHENESLYFQTAGDANEKPDANHIAASQVMGAVNFHIPLAGYLLNFIKQPVGYGLLVCLPAIIIIAVMLKKITTQIRLENGSESRRVA